MSSSTKPRSAPGHSSTVLTRGLRHSSANIVWWIRKSSLSGPEGRSTVAPGRTRQTGRGPVAPWWRARRAWACMLS